MVLTWSSLPEALLLPLALGSNQRHLGWTSEPARLTVRHVACHSQDNNAKHHQSVQSNSGQLNQKKLCAILHGSQPREWY